MSLARRAFPSLGERELDRLLKGRCFQALLPKWQRKLGAPKVGESFQELYERARTSEQHDQQYRGGAATPLERTLQAVWGWFNWWVGQQGNHSHGKRLASIECFKCGKQGHVWRHCPDREDKSEAQGKSKQPPASAATVGAMETSPISSGNGSGKFVSSLSDEQLQEILTSRHCLKEQTLLDAQVSTVVAHGPTAAAGGTLELDM